MKLLYEVEHNLRLVRYSPGRIEFEPTHAAPANLAATLSQRLQGWTGARWGVSVVSDGGAATVAEERGRALSEAEERVREDPLVQAVLQAFPNAQIVRITPFDAAPAVAEADLDSSTDPGEDWDPFEDD
jgi:DNA polymerase III subunit gamma/tau